MSYTVEKLSGEPAIVVRFNADFDAATEAQKAFETSASLLAKQTGPTFVIWDVRQSAVNLEGLMQGANVSRMNVTPTNERGSIVVTNNPVVKMAMEGMNSEMYGNVVVPVFGEIHEAIAYIHQQNG